MPGLFAGGTIVFIFAFTELGVPLLFDYSRVTSVQIFYGMKEIAGNPFPFALVVVMLVSTVLLYAVSKLLFGARATRDGGQGDDGPRGADVGTPLARWACTRRLRGRRRRSRCCRTRAWCSSRSRTTGIAASCRLAGRMGALRSRARASASPCPRSRTA